MDVVAHGLRRTQHYTATVVAYSDSLSLKSKNVDICESFMNNHNIFCQSSHTSPCVSNYMHILFTEPQHTPVLLYVVCVLFQTLVEFRRLRC